MCVEFVSMKGFYGTGRGVFRLGGGREGDWEAILGPAARAVCVDRCLEW